MANTRYPKARQSSLSGSPSIDMDSQPIKFLLVKTAQAYNAAHQYVADITAGNIVARSAALTGKTVTDGVFDSDPAVFTTPAAGSNCNVIMYQDTTVDATSPLIAFYDTGTNFPIPTNDLDITVDHNNTANKWFAV